MIYKIADIPRTQYLKIGYSNILWKNCVLSMKIDRMKVYIYEQLDNDFDIVR